MLLGGVARKPPQEDQKKSEPVANGNVEKKEEAASKKALEAAQAVKWEINHEMFMSLDLLQ